VPSVLDVLDLVWRFVFWNGVYSLVDRKHIGLRPRTIFLTRRSTIISIVPLGSGSFTGYVGICHLFATYMGRTRRERKKELDEHPKDL